VLHAGKLWGAGGSVFSLTHQPDGKWKETILSDFPHDGDANAHGGPVFDPAGNLYGNTFGGGTHNAGIVYELESQPNGGWKEQTLHNFPAFAGDGQVMSLGVALIRDAKDGSLYGVTSQGGRYTCGNAGCGTIYRLSRRADGSWHETILYNFVGGSLGSGPGGGVVMDKYGNLYGTTVYDGSTNCGCGVVYKLSPGPKDKWSYSLLHTFIGTDGAQPDASLILDDKGNLYGTAATGGPGGAGVAFEITP
jgi:uncharacterized repeat protein (TIGR03803 family)